MELTKEDHEALEIAVGRVLRLYREREELRRKPRTVEESVRLADISAALYHAERQDMTDDEYAKAEKAAARKRDAAEGFE